MFGGFEEGPGGEDEKPRKINRFEALDAVITEHFEGYPLDDDGSAQTDSDGKGGKGGAVQTDNDDDDDDILKKKLGS